MVKAKEEVYSMLPVSHWWKLREIFKKSIPGIVTDNYLATVLNIKEISAQTNVKPYLRMMGIIGEEGKIQDLAKAWRDDEQYSDVCKQIIRNIYPEELIHAVPNPSEDRSAVERWFANKTGSGNVAVKRMSAIYVVLSDADISKRPEERIQRKQASKKQKPVLKEEKNRESKTVPSPTMTINANKTNIPSVNINLEIHISSDATSDQIDKIFESMAKHIYGK